jgi:lipopolysaccharide heptosyltransferase I
MTGDGRSAATSAAPTALAGFDPERLRRLLVVKMSSLGDVVHALPVAAAVKHRWPGLRLTWAVEEPTAQLLRGHPSIDRVVALPPLRWRVPDRAWLRGLGGAIAELRREPYDVALDLQGLLKSALVSLLSRAALRVGREGQREGAQLVSHGLPRPRGRQHVVDSYLDCAAALGAAARPASFDLPVDAAAARAVERLLEASGIAAGEPLIVVNPSSSDPRRTWPGETWAAAIAGLATAGRVVLVGDRSQRSRHARIAALAPRGILDLTGKTSLGELVALLARSALHVAPDTGSLHVAAALGRPAVGLFGPTRAWRKGPYGQLEWVVSQSDLCAPTCPRRCPGERRCLAAVEPAELVAQAFRRLTEVAEP